MNNHIKTIITATGQEAMDNVVARFDGYQSIAKVYYKKELFSICESHSPDIILVSEGLAGNENLSEILMSINKSFPQIRIVYLTGYVDYDEQYRVNALGMLAMAGIRDLVMDKKLNPATLKYALDNPKEIEDLEMLLSRVKTTARKTEEQMVDFEDFEEESNSDGGYPNVFVISSIKPGTGKSFVSSNIATAIAKFGQTKNGKSPSVALIEADLQNLSIGTLLGMEDSDRNLLTAMNKIAEITTENEVVGDVMKIEKTNKEISNCFVQYHHVKNLEALVGSNLTFSQVDNIQPHHYFYLVDLASKLYDVVIVDSNSSLTHVTSSPILQMAKSCYYILNLDFNNVRNNFRYRETLEEIGIANKVKYILNEDVVPGMGVEKLQFNADVLDASGFELEARIPSLDKSIFLNRLYEGRPIILDEKEYTADARFEILKVANTMWEIKNFDVISAKYEKFKKKRR